MKRISAKEFSEQYAAAGNLAVVDVRTPAEFNSVFLPGSTNVPVSDIHPQAVHDVAETGPVYLMCRTQKRAEMACEKLAGQVKCELVVIEGGIENVDPKLLRQGARKTIALDRQMRITAGLMVLVGVAGGFFIHPVWFGLSGFVGAGLMFSGITDACPMLMVLARMPWNKA
ncbi:rhodanese-like domain-containing protein [Simiduia sp. 21SJ11W-1]|uniref:rhodanese-like domain-containing protein n=1 Tax=Simiduia sp. 21SJ11W-1 TaxID=2909669 RepID=UPI0020A077CC|nr:rhodanese-like domain-containing protein [Simiduia sp. 21SJ11W-1]UTA48974.1 rhodanese-like domain-containing protein [Simiduia sp. 21SJ11W-1]